jgi:hypothetical protein
MMKANRFFDVLRQLFNRWSRIRLAMICDGALLRESASDDFCGRSKTIFVDTRK